MYVDGAGAQSLLEQHAGGAAPSDIRVGSITHLPLRARRDVLEAALTPQPRRVELARHVRVEAEGAADRREALMGAYDHALEVGGRCCGSLGVSLSAEVDCG